MTKLELSDFEIEVCKDCYKITKETNWCNKVSNWFYRMDFIPAYWQETYKTYIKYYL